MNMRLLDNRLLVRLLPNKENGGLIVIPDVVRNKRDEFGRSASGTFRGRVISVGPGRRTPGGNRVPLDVGPGDIVWFSGLNDWESDGLMIIRETDIALVEGDPLDA